MADAVLTLRETARVLKISEPTARKLAAAGRLPLVELGPRTRRVPVAALQRVLEQGTIPAVGGDHGP